MPKTLVETILQDSLSLVYPGDCGVSPTNFVSDLWASIPICLAPTSELTLMFCTLELISKLIALNHGYLTALKGASARGRYVHKLQPGSLPHRHPAINDTIAVREQNDVGPCVMNGRTVANTVQ